MQNVPKVKSAICKFCASDVLHIFIRDATGTSVERGGVSIKTDEVGQGGVKQG